MDFLDTINPTGWSQTQSKYINGNLELIVPLFQQYRIVKTITKQTQLYT